MNRPDFSNYLAHFTKDALFCVKEGQHDSLLAYQNFDANRRLISILEERKIHASIMPWTHASAVCFTECPWTSLLSHTKTYSSYGIGFNKSFIYSRHGGPVFYIRPDHFKKQQARGSFDKHVWPFITPFAPSYRPKHMKGSYFPTVDYSQEREWRVPHDLPFEYSDIEFIILKDYHDMASFPKELKNAIGREKFILMDNYEQVERLWPVHIK